jgi:PAS domain S-box-containing protein
VKKKKKTPKQNPFKRENERLGRKLEEAQDTLRAIQSGEVDALVVRGKDGEQVFTLKSAEKPYRLLVETMNEGAATVDGSGLLFYCNARFSEMAEQPLEHLMGSSIYDLIIPSERNGFTELFDRCKKNRLKGEFAMRRKKTSLMPVLFSMSPVEVEGTLGVCVVATDLTGQKKLEESRADLERLHIEKNLREQFISTLSHDLRTPLTAAKMGAQLIVRHPDEHQRHLVQGARIIKQIERADKMIQDLLDTSRIRAGEKIPLEISECDLRKIAEETLSDLAMSHGERFVLEATGPVTGYWSCSHLRRVIENLTTNAIKYGSARAPVKVILHQADDHVELIVHNEGDPISKNEQKNIFKPFARTQSAMASGQIGWGLGLILVRGVAESHGGSVRVESSGTKGTSFIVSLPCDSRLSFS